MRKAFALLVLLALTACASPTPPPGGISPEGHYYLGPKDAKVFIEEYSDFQCPYCGLYVRETLPKIKSEYIEKGLVRYQFINMPLRSIHPAAQKAAEAALCAGKQGKFWEMHDLLYERQGEWAGQISPLKTFEGYASQIGLNVEKFRTCLQTGETALQVQNDLAEAARRGVTATPTFFINGRKLEGAYPYEVFKAIIEEELRK